ncbi:alpha/beta-hydrolase [Hesseltinella vesiculosa]|uniref:Alpha/beta-hydrolase n=1 Tax=Hesseltinella vesiculosa TaxID=101127 RepID=A0A1X2GCD9_9FUNG|nr:alpha/beta-hydrolase [Hesseltinella vesiculosa]
MYLLHAQTDAEFNLPYSPARVLKINIIVLNHLFSWVVDLPIVLTYLYWRYWQLGTEKFRRIVSRDVVYSEASKECVLDIYHPDGKTKIPTKKRPTIVFIHGGSWSSGQKLIYTPMGNTLRELGYVVVIPDYRKYPAGHSAGAQLAAQVVLSDLLKKASLLSAKGNTDIHAHCLPQVEGLLLFAGVYNIETHYQHEAARGVEKISAMGRAMGATIENFRRNSPLELVKSHADLFATSEDLLDFAPRILFVHGEKDTTVPLQQSTDMYNMLGEVLPPERRDEVDIRMRLYKKLKHAHCVSALMPSKLGANRHCKPLIRDIMDFVEVPSLDEQA